MSIPISKLLGVTVISSTLTSNQQTTSNFPDLIAASDIRWVPKVLEMNITIN